eukprot:TRINITY_DN46533_c0_g1_i1.p1 TRINITY_DN46533_c0_g1~~TRINITY_DN46533_c0_g1_i1.p1  ORF type:complete len:354 (+),score=75.96 TRINITY_DN46533_c0_g1_i1:69-1130(+)
MELPDDYEHELDTEHVVDEDGISLAWNKVKESMAVIDAAVTMEQLGELELGTLIEWELRLRDASRAALKTKKKERKLKRKREPVEAREMRKREKAERKIEQGLKGMVRVRKAPVGSATMEAAYNLIERLEETVLSRPSLELLEEDLPIIQAIGHNMSTASIYSDALSPHRVDEVPGVMTRLFIHTGKGIDVRLHMFPDATETYIHNHRNNFVSMCLYGSYTHNIWVVSNDGGRHYETARADNGELSPLVQCPGSLLVATSYIHSINKVFFLNKETHHTVETSPTPSPLPGTLTLYVKGKRTDTQTTVLCKDTRFEDSPQPVDRTLSPDECAVAVSKMKAMLRLAAADHFRTPV